MESNLLNGCNPGIVGNYYGFCLDAQQAIKALLSSLDFYPVGTAVKFRQIKRTVDFGDIPRDLFGVNFCFRT